jgi:hypothetical protein
MVEFDSLPQTSRSLMLATLALELASADCRNVFELARKRHQSVADVWRDVCRKTGQPRCTIPLGVTRPDSIATGFSPEPAAAASAPAASTSPTAPSAAASSAAKPATAHSAPSSTAKSTVAIANAQRSFSGRTIAVAAGLCAVCVIGIGLLVVMPRSTDHTASTARPTEAVRVKANEPVRAEQQTVVAPPQGTTRRMEEINKAFTKR